MGQVQERPVTSPSWWTCDVTCGVASQGTSLSAGGQVSLGTRLTAHGGGLDLQPLQRPREPIISADSLAWPSAPGELR